MIRRPTLRDIAKATGYHFTTVGLALRGDPRIHPQTVTAIRAAAQEIGYTPDAMLSALSAYRHIERPHIVGVIGYLHTFELPGDYLTDLRARLLFDSAAARARALGFKLEAISIRSSGLTGKRLTGILKTRGIHGLILPPLFPHPGHFLELDWSQFATVAVGYSILSPKTHRTAFNQAANMQLALRELRRLGYQRIGLQLYPEIDTRTNSHPLGAYLADQLRQPEAERIPPLFATELTPAALRQWIETHRPDCILTASPELLGRVQALGVKVPDDIGLALLSRNSVHSLVAGVDEQADLLGSSAVDFTVSLLQTSQQGLPPFPRIVLVEGQWVWGPTVRPPMSL